MNDSNHSTNYATQYLYHCQSTIPTPERDRDWITRFKQIHSVTDGMINSVLRNILIDHQLNSPSPREDVEEKKTEEEDEEEDEEENNDKENEDPTERTNATYQFKFIEQELIARYYVEHQEQGIHLSHVKKVPIVPVTLKQEEEKQSSSSGKRQRTEQDEVRCECEIECIGHYHTTITDDLDMNLHGWYQKSPTSTGCWEFIRGYSDLHPPLAYNPKQTNNVFPCKYDDHMYRSLSKKGLVDMNIWMKILSYGPRLQQPQKKVKHFRFLGKKDAYYIRWWYYEDGGYFTFYFDTNPRRYFAEEVHLNMWFVNPYYDHWDSLLDVFYSSVVL